MARALRTKAAGILLMVAGFTAIAVVVGFVVFLYGRDNQVGHFRALLVQAGDRCPCGGKVVTDMAACGSGT